MGSETKIQWCDHTASPWHGCSKVSTGCANCYAAATAVRNPDTLGIWGDDGTRIKSKSFVASLEKWNREGEKLGRQVSVFPSICDPFEDRPELVPWRAEMFAAADRLPWVRLLLLTKRPENIARMWSDIAVCPDCRGNLWPDESDQHRWCLACRKHWPLTGPRSNVFLGTSIEDQATADERIPELLACRGLAPVLFVSAEPLLEAVDLCIERGCRRCNHHGDVLLPRETCRRCNGTGQEPTIHWVIAGGESGPKARPCDVAWIRSIVEQCAEAGVPCFVKQMGSNVVTRNDMVEDAFNNGWSGWPDPTVEYDIHGFREDYQGADCRIRLRDPKGGDPAEWPENLRVRELPGSKP